MALALTAPERVERLLVLDMAPVSYGAADASGWGDNVDIINELLKVDVKTVNSQVDGTPAAPTRFDRSEDVFEGRNVRVPAPAGAFESPWGRAPGLAARSQTPRCASTQLKNKRDADAFLARTVADPGLRAFVLMNLVRRSGGEGFAWRINLPAIASSLDELASWDFGDAPQYGGNTLFIAAGRSKYVRSSHLPAIEQHFARFSLSKIRNAAHWIHADEPDALRLIVTKFFDVPGA